MAGPDPTLLATVLERISRGELSIKLLDELLAMPAEMKRENAPELKDLLSSEQTLVRVAMVRELPQGWLASDRAIEAAKSALRDDAPPVRNAALQALRQLRGEC